MSDTKYLAAALLVFVAKGDGNIADEEASAMVELLNEHFDISSAESLSLLTTAMEDLSEKADSEGILKALAKDVSTHEKEEIALMMLKTVAADGRRDAGEMEKVRQAADIIEIPAETLHRAYDRYFEQTQV